MFSNFQSAAITFPHSVVHQGARGFKHAAIVASGFILPVKNLLLDKCNFQTPSPKGDATIGSIKPGTFQELFKKAIMNVSLDLPKPVWIGDFELDKHSSTEFYALAINELKLKRELLLALKNGPMLLKLDPPTKRNHLKAFRSVLSAGRGPASYGGIALKTFSASKGFSYMEYTSNKGTIRGFKSRADRTIGALESEANQDPNNPIKQAEFYKELFKGGYYSLVINRFENYDLGTNLDCLQIYIQALIKNNQSDKVASRILHAIQTKAGLQDLKLASNPEIIRNLSTGYLSDTDRAAPLPTGGNKSQPLHVVVEESSSISMWKTIRSVGSGLTMVFLLLTFMSLVMENSGLSKAQPKIHPEFEPDSNNSVTFDDVQGVDEAKAELIEMVDFLKDPSRYNDMGGKLPKGILLTGPPGTGKTLLARAVAGEAGVPFFFMSGSEFDEMYVGVGARRVRDLFAAARKKAPSIVFIDEIDAIGSKRNPKDQAYMKQTLNQLLVDLDGFSPTEGVIFIGATNFPELLDKALVRPGRFDRHIDVSLPDVRGRVQVLKLHSKNINIDENVDFEVIARGTPGFSGAELANLVNQAAIEASRKRLRKVTEEHFEFAKDRIIMGAEKKSMVITEKSRRITAYHEGGHALVAYYTPCAMPLHKATVIPRDRSLGMTVQLPEIDKVSYSKCEYNAMMDVCMGGRIAEELLLGEDHITSGASNDFQQATRTARSMVTQLGMSAKLGVMDYASDYQQLSSETKMEIDAQIKKLLDDSYARATNILKSKRTELDRLANALIQHETLNRAQMDEVIKGKPPTF